MRVLCTLLYKSTPSRVFMASLLDKHRNKFVFYYDMSRILAHCITRRIKGNTHNRMRRNKIYRNAITRNKEGKGGAKRYRETKKGRHSKVKVTSQLTVSQSLCQGIEPILGFVTRYYSYFLSEGCFLKFAVLFFWGALSDERSGLSFVILCLVICHYLQQIFTLHVFYSSAIHIQ
jgi:hypothetical protein